MGTIAANVRRVLAGLPPGVRLVAAAKGRQPAEILEAIEAGVTAIGENYVQEAEAARRVVDGPVEWHFIGHLQKNKVKKAAVFFDMIQTVDSLDIAREIDVRCAGLGKTMPVLIEVNSAREPQKSGVFPEHVEALVKDIGSLRNLRVVGLMTMGPLVENPLEARPYFAVTRRVFEAVARQKLAGVEMRYLSMGMSQSYLVAISEGANMVRVGREIFGER